MGRSAPDSISNPIVSGVMVLRFSGLDKNSHDSSMGMGIFCLEWNVKSFKMYNSEVKIHFVYHLSKKIKQIELFFECSNALVHLKQTV
mmetsp:Transcript_26515/g.64382  ORF Transcript_26515/g.64382 Transcript_26515/m.64382 type:complete len:88 (+) Transcript_26515:1113-1376(+)